MDKKAIRRKLWDSLEFHHYKAVLLGSAVVFCIMFFPFLGRSTAAVLTTLVVFLAFCGFYFHRMLQILRHPEAYVFTRCKLEESHVSLFWKTSYFSVRLEMPEVGIVNGKTAAVFSTHGILPPVTKDYVNREVQVGYNRFTGRIVVIG